MRLDEVKRDVRVNVKGMKSPDSKSDGNTKGKNRNDSADNKVDNCKYAIDDKDHKALKKRLNGELASGDTETLDYEIGMSDSGAPIIKDSTKLTKVKTSESFKMTFKETLLAEKKECDDDKDDSKSEDDNDDKDENKESKEESKKDSKKDDKKDSKKDDKKESKDKADSDSPDEKGEDGDSDEDSKKNSKEEDDSDDSDDEDSKEEKSEKNSDSDDKDDAKEKDDKDDKKEKTKSTGKKKVDESVKNNYEAGDVVATALGDGKITSIEQQGERGEYVMVQPSKLAQKTYKLKDRPYKMGWSEILKHIG